MECAPGERGRKRKEKSVGFNPKANERYDNNIYRRRRGLRGGQGGMSMYGIFISGEILRP